MTNQELISELKRLSDITSRIVSSVHGVIRKPMADKWVELTDLAESRGIPESAYRN